MAVVRESSLATISGNVDWRLLGVVDDVLDARLAERQGAEVTESVDIRFFEVVEERLVAVLLLALERRMIFGPSHLATLGGLLVQFPEFDDRSWAESDLIVERLEGVGSVDDRSWTESDLIVERLEGVGSVDDRSWAESDLIVERLEGVGSVDDRSWAESDLIVERLEGAGSVDDGS